MRKNIEINIPTSLNEITLRQFKEFKKRIEGVETDSEIQKIVLSVFCGVTLNDSLKVKASDAAAVTDIVLEMFNEKPQRITKFNLNGKPYGIIPKLDDMSLGEYVDLEKNIVDYEFIEYAMAVLYRPIKNEFNNLYNLVDYEPEKYNMLDMPMSAVLYAQVFFYNLGNDLLKTMNHYLQEQQTDLLRKMGLIKGGDGSIQFMHSLTGMLQDLNISLN